MAWSAPRCARRMATATSAMCSPMARRTAAGFATASTPRPCASFPATEWRPRAMAPISTRWRVSKMTERAVTERAVLAGGCFWGMQDLIRKLPGVVSTRVGYTGGDVPNATYRNHGTHAEGIEIVFDPEKIGYRRILEFFFQIHDPTTKNRQGNDVGLSYRSAIYYLDEEQKRIAEDTIADVNASRSEEHTSELQSLMRISYAVFCLKKKTKPI